ncbi:hypothetical protein PsorP6_010509 [Peronosclerospora sorghi]|uniref:Uncharacterized protein n=1 Tax=Peronosclerospora sorghi TaxID=230839 RepID=A0ACC0VWD1_9STRA|nr:hypothetical protein PsorP6_010509 [Peronosclerospora sorghi]
MDCILHPGDEIALELMTPVERTGINERDHAMKRYFWKRQFMYHRSVQRRVELMQNSVNEQNVNAQAKQCGVTG